MEQCGSCSKPAPVRSEVQMVGYLACSLFRTVRWMSSVQPRRVVVLFHGIMLNTVLLCCWALQVVLTSGTTRAELDSNAVSEEATYTDLAFLSRSKALLSAAGPLTKPTLDGEIDLLKEDRSSGKIEANLELVPNAGEMDRSKRAPRRCVRHLESCFGHPLPCCDPCAICYCRFFNAICYCRKIGHDCHLGKN
ncbi:agouti-related protein [Amblyraja radiata]|uniref:agouti-related protein n=1 Tax=Amblyraja radiata TaxID=386614 RepID=UPI001403564C|nr:agouti-related protein [Amblyraja radiata]